LTVRPALVEGWVDIGALSQADPQRRDLAATLFALEGKSSPSIEPPDLIADSVRLDFPIEDSRHRQERVEL
jgi:hypothetical protein